MNINTIVWFKFSLLFSEAFEDSRYYYIMDLKYLSKKLHEILYNCPAQGHSLWIKSQPHNQWLQTLSKKLVSKYENLLWQPPRDDLRKKK